MRVKRWFVAAVLCVACAVSAVAANVRLQQSLDSLARACGARIGVAVVRGDTVVAEVHGGELFPMSSVFKLPLALAVLDSMQRSGVSLDDSVTLRREELREDTWSPMREQLAGGRLSVTVGELIGYALVQSDNNAADALLSRFGGCVAVNRYLECIGVDASEMRVCRTEAEMQADPASAVENCATPLASARLALDMVTLPLVDERFQAWVTEQMRGCRTGENRLAKYLQGRVLMFGHKTGTGFVDAQGQQTGVNDVAFVVPYGGSPLGIAVYVTDAAMSLADAEEIIAQVARLVVENL